MCVLTRATDRQEFSYAYARFVAELRVKRRQRLRYAVIAVAVIVTVLCIGLAFAAISNDRAISSSMGTANAQVDSVSSDRTIIRYQTTDGTTHSPRNGVLYPGGLRAGQLVRIEYDRDNPDLARVAGRSASGTILPLGGTVLGTWLVAALLLYFLRRQSSVSRSG